MFHLAQHSQGDGPNADGEVRQPAAGRADLGRDAGRWAGEVDGTIPIQIP
jgi:hypothetical protein